MKNVLLEQIISIAKNKKNGVYSKQGIRYAVKDGRVVLLAEGKCIYQFCYGFLASIGEVEYSFQSANKLKELLKNI